jgi:transcription initiation factor TFIIIB Brf1 subunit/transcription initiation factor TFIIB
MTSAKYLLEAETQYYRNCKWKRNISVLNRSISIFCNVRYKILVQEDSVYNIFHDSTISIYKMMVEQR